IDLGKHHPEADGRAAAAELAALLTPLSKAWGTDLGVETTNLALQVHGGMGYVEETGVAQHVRDARIAPIYEGTNGIQAIDLVGRKLPMAGGGGMRALCGELALTAESLTETPELTGVGRSLAEGVAALDAATDWVLA